MEIKINYSAVMREVTKLRTIAAELRQQQTLCRSARTTVPSFWTGASANAMTAKLTAWERDTASSATEIEKLAAEVKRVADSIKAAEDAIAARINAASNDDN